MTPLTRFNAWLIGERGTCAAIPLSAATLPEIERELAHSLYHRRSLIVREIDARDASTRLHFYTIRKGAWFGTYDADLKRIYRMTADRLFTVQVTAFDPVEPWRWVPDADVVGRDAGLVVVR